MELGLVIIIISQPVIVRNSLNGRAANNKLELITGNEIF